MNVCMAVSQNVNYLERLEAILDFLLFAPLSKMKALLWQ